MSVVTAVHVYGIVPAGTVVPENLLGIDDHPVLLVRRGDVAAVVSPADPDRVLGRRADLLAHSRVLDGFAARGPVVPIRFGSVLDSTQAVVDDLLDDVGHFRSVLEELRGRAQFTLRARYEEATVLAEIVAEQPEVARLREQTRDRPEQDTYAARIRLGELVSRALAGKRDADARALLDPLVEHAVSYDVTESTGEDALLDAAFLVDDERREAFTRAAEDLAESMAGRARLRLLGPLAPYNFVPAG